MLCKERDPKMFQSEGAQGETVMLEENQDKFCQVRFIVCFKRLNA